MARLHLRIVTPEQIKLEEDVDMVIMRCVTGDMGILPNHEACSAVLDYGALRIISEGGERRIAVYGGIVQVHDNIVSVLANGAQWPEDIDVSAAQAERDRAQSLIESESPSTDSLTIQRDHIKLRRSLVQIEVSSYSILGSKHHV
ncbi:MAG: ATP synthase F1 subunit epsilon [Oscillospiraceae bacterium]|jgi:F-type H+-transporting ATPase subunit epsilon|nr:ATP synthase F1 subunit epsilon [Oscillospiraceae bacterium]